MFVSKSDGSLRAVCDFRAVNALTVKTGYPLPRIEALLACLSGSRVYSRIDLLLGYANLRVADDDAHEDPYTHTSSCQKTCIRTSLGSYEFTSLPLGLCGSPGSFQTFMDHIFSDLKDVCVLSYLDDILIYSKNETDHLVHLKTVLSRLKQHKLACSIKKCVFMVPSCAFLGFQVDQGHLNTDRHKVDAIKEYAPPSTKQGLQRYLGACSWFRGFIFDFSQVAKPLTDCLRKEVLWPIEWTQERLLAFNTLKERLITAPTLAVGDPSKPYTLYTDASGVALGAVLLQEKEEGGGLQPIAFESRKLKDEETRYTVGEQELLAICHAFKVWRAYLEGALGTIVMSDHNNLKYLMASPRLAGKRAGWMEKLQAFDFSIVHVKGSNNEFADALSRQERYASAIANFRASQEGQQPRARITFQTLIKEPFDLRGLLEEAYSSKDTLRLIDKVQSAKGKTLFREKEGRLYWYHQRHISLLGTKQEQKGRLFVPAHGELRQVLISESHDAAGHLGSSKTATKLARHYYWPQMHAEVRRYTSSCHSCQVNKRRLFTPGLLQPLPIPLRKGEEFSSDFITKLPKTKNGFDSVWVICDRLTKRVWYIPTRTDVKAVELVKPFYDRVVSQGAGVPKILLSDRDSKFTSGFWQELWHLLGTKLKFSTAGHPETDGQTERANLTFEELIRSYCNASTDDWDEHLSAAEFSYNDTVHPGTGFTPFFLERGQHPTSAQEIVLKNSPGGLPSVAAITAEQMQEHINIARMQLQHAQVAMKRNADKRRKDIEFQEGDQVLLSAKFLPLPQAERTKFSKPWYGPYTVTKKFSKLVYSLNLPGKYNRMCQRINIDNIKPYITDSDMMRPLEVSPLPLDEEADIWEVEDVLMSRKRSGKKEYLIKWKGFPMEDNSWVPYNFISNPEVTLKEFRRREAAQRQQTLPTSSQPVDTLPQASPPAASSSHPVSAPSAATRRSSRTRRSTSDRERGGG